VLRVDRAVIERLSRYLIGKLENTQGGQTHYLKVI